MAGAGGDDIVGWVDTQSVTGDLEAVEHGDVELVELDLAFKTGAEGFDDAAFKDGAGAAEHNFSDNE